MVPSGLPLRLLLGAALLAGASSQLRAQAWDGSTTGNQNWLLATNWVGDVIPNAVDATATFGTAFSGNPSGPYWSGQSITVGTLNFTQSSGNVAFGFNGTTRATMVLATSAGGPTLSVSNANATAFSYGLLEGTQGFTKTGAGKLTFRFNTADQTYSGTVTLAGGTLGINQNGSLGNADNDLVFSANSTLIFEPGTNSGTVELGSGRTLTVNSGVTASLQASNAAITGVVNGVVGGSGNLSIGGSGVITLNATSTLSGGVTVGAGTLSLGHATNTLADTASVVVSGGTLALGSNADTIGSLSLSSGSLTGSGTLTSGAFSFSSASDLSVGTLLAGSGYLNKSGAGNLTLTRSNTYTGTTTVSAGTLTLGHATDTLSNTGALNITGGTLALGSNSETVGAVSLGSGAITGTGTLTGSGYTFNNTAAASVSAVLAGSGALTKSLGGLLTLTGANTYTGITRITSGGAIALGSGGKLGGGDLHFESTSAAGNLSLDLGGAAQTVTRLYATGSGPTAAVTVTATNGSLTVQGADRTLSFTGLYHGSVVDLSGLSALVFNRSGQAVILQPGTSQTTNTVRLKLSASSNTFTASAVTFGGAPSGGTANTAYVELGATNVFNVGGTFQVGGFNAGGEVAFASGLTAPSLKLRAVNGTSALASLIVGETSSGTRSGYGVLDLSAGTLDAVVTDISIGRHVAGANLTPSASTLSMGGGVLVASTLRLSTKTGTGTPTLTSDFNLGGGVARVGTVTLGDTSALTGAQDVRLLPTLNLNGGEFLATSITTAGSFFASNSARAINLADGATLGTYRSADGATTTDLTVAAAGSSAAERITLTLAGASNLRAESGRTFTLGANTLLAGSGGFAKTGDGTLVLGQGASYSGATAVSAGVLNLRHAAGLGATAAGTSVASGAALELQGGIEVAAESLTLAGSGVSSGGALRNVSGANSWSGSVSLSAAATVASDAGTLTLSGGISGAHTLTLDGAGNLVLSGAVGTVSGGLTKQGAGSATLSGHNTFSGDVTVSAGTLALGHLSALGTGLVLLNGGVLDLAGYNPANEVRVAGGSVSGAQNWDREVLVTGSVGSSTLNTLGSGLIRVGAGASVSLGGVTKNLTLDGGSVASFGDYAGTLTLASGTSLDLDGAGNTPVSTSAGLVVASGSTLSGSGSIGGFTSVAGTHDVGNSPGSQSFASGLSYDSTAVVRFEYTLDALANYGSPSSRGADFDAINVTGGDLTVASGAVVDLVAPAGNDFAGAFWDTARSFKFIDVWSSGAITGAFVLSASSPSAVPGQGSWSIASSEGGDNGIYLQWTPVPEPSTYGLALGALALALSALRRRRHS